MKTANNPRHQSRIIALQKLFELEFNSSSTLQFSDLQEINKLQNNPIMGMDTEYAQMLIKGVNDNKIQLDELIKKYIQKRAFEDTAKIDIMILRISLYELMYSSIKIPLKVIIDESVELAKEFGGNKSFTFINGILAKVSNDNNSNANK